MLDQLPVPYSESYKGLENLVENIFHGGIR